MANNRVILVGEKQLEGDQTVYRLRYVDDDDLEIANPVDTGADVKLTGYTAQSAGNVLATHSVNVAIAKLEARIVALETP